MRIYYDIANTRIVKLAEHKIENPGDLHLTELMENRLYLLAYSCVKYGGGTTQKEIEDKWEELNKQVESINEQERKMKEGTLEDLSKLYRMYADFIDEINHLEYLEQECARRWKADWSKSLTYDFHGDIENYSLWVSAVDKLSIKRAHYDTISCSLFTPKLSKTYQGRGTLLVFDPQYDDVLLISIKDSGTAVVGDLATIKDLCNWPRLVHNKIVSACTGGHDFFSSYEDFVYYLDEEGGELLIKNSSSPVAVICVNEKDYEFAKGLSLVYSIPLYVKDGNVLRLQQGNKSSTHAGFWERIRKGR